MILHTRKGETGRKIERVNEPIATTGSGWNHLIGHYVTVGPLVGSDGVSYTLTLTESDLSTLAAVWERGAADRERFDKELHRP